MMGVPESLSYASIAALPFDPWHDLRDGLGFRVPNGWYWVQGLGSGVEARFGVISRIFGRSFCFSPRVVNPPPSLNTEYNRDPNVKALTDRWFANFDKLKAQGFKLLGLIQTPHKGTA